MKPLRLVGYLFLVGTALLAGGRGGPRELVAGVPPAEGNAASSACRECWDDWDDYGAYHFFYGESCGHLKCGECDPSISPPSGGTGCHTYGDPYWGLTCLEGHRNCTNGFAAVSRDALERAVRGGDAVGVARLLQGNVGLIALDRLGNDIVVLQSCEEGKNGMSIVLGRALMDAVVKLADGRAVDPT